MPKHVDQIIADDTAAEKNAAIVYQQQQGAPSAPAIIHHMETRNLQHAKAELYRTGLLVSGHMTDQEFIGLLVSNAHLHDATRWWIGDTLAHGEDHHADIVGQLISDGVIQLTGRSVDNLKYICTQVPIYRVDADGVAYPFRIDTLSCWTHKNVAPYSHQPHTQFFLLQMMQRLSEKGYTTAQIKNWIDLWKVKRDTLQDKLQSAGSMFVLPPEPTEAPTEPDHVNGHPDTPDQPENCPEGADFEPEQETGPIEDAESGQPSKLSDDDDLNSVLMIDLNSPVGKAARIVLRQFGISIKKGMVISIE